MKTALQWLEFDGVRSERVSDLTHETTFILVFRRGRDGAVDLEVTHVSTLGADGWHFGRNEMFTHWAPIGELPT